jgi:hypothetical protein
LNQNQILNQSRSQVMQSLNKILIITFILVGHVHANSLSDVEASNVGCSQDQMEQMCKDHSKQLDKCGVPKKDRLKHCMDRFEAHALPNGGQTLIPKGSKISGDVQLPGSIAICEPTVIESGVVITGDNIVIREAVELRGRTELTGNNIELKATRIQDSKIKGSAKIIGATNKGFDAIVDFNGSTVGENGGVVINGENSKVVINGSELDKNVNIQTVYDSDPKKNKIQLDGVVMNKQNDDPGRVVSVKGSNINIAKVGDREHHILGSILCVPGMDNYDRGINLSKQKHNFVIEAGSVLGPGKYSKDFKGTDGPGDKSPPIGPANIQIAVSGEMDRQYLDYFFFEKKHEGKQYFQMSMDERAKLLESKNSDSDFNSRFSGNGRGNNATDTNVTSGIMAGRTQLFNFYNTIDQLGLTPDEKKKYKAETLKKIEMTYALNVSHEDGVYVNTHPITISSMPTLLYMGEKEENIAISGVRLNENSRSHKSLHHTQKPTVILGQ